MDYQFYLTLTSFVSRNILSIVLYISMQWSSWCQFSILKMYLFITAEAGQYLDLLTP